jgi:hypothetical protein
MAVIAFWKKSGRAANCNSVWLLVGMCLLVSRIKHLAWFLGYFDHLWSLEPFSTVHVLHAMQMYSYPSPGYHRVHMAFRHCIQTPKCILHATAQILMTVARGGDVGQATL